MIDRRWFFSAAGAAFLSACSSVVPRAKDARPSLANARVDRPTSRDEQFALMLEKFFFGLESELKGLKTDGKTPPQVPAGRAALEAIFRKPLTDIYRSRFDHRFDAGGLPDSKWPLLLDQACVLGQLTGLAFAYESGLKGDGADLSFDAPRPRPALDIRHLEWARETYGFYTNPKISKKREIILCGEPGGPVQIGEPCPFCEA